MGAERCGRPVVKQDSQCQVCRIRRTPGVGRLGRKRAVGGGFGALASRLLTSCSNTALTCHSSTPGNHSRKSFTVAPAARLPNSADTGTRVLVNTQAPLSLPGHAFHGGALAPVRHTVTSRSTVDSSADSPALPRMSSPDSSATADRTSSLPVTTSAIRRLPVLEEKVNLLPDSDSDSSYTR